MDVPFDKRILAGVGVVLTTFSGACWGYLYGHREAEIEFNHKLEDILEVEINKVRERYAIRYKDTEPEDHSDLDGDPVVDQQHIIIDKAALATPEGRAAVIAKLSEAIQDTPDVDDEEDSDVETERVFDKDDAYTPVEYDFEALMADRSVDAPYVVSQEEFLRNEAKYEEHALTFFEKDGVLIDEDDVMIPDTDQVVGDANLQRFGVMSNDNNVVYIQNDRTETLFVVTRTFQSAAQAMYGVDDDVDTVLEHSSMKRRHPRHEE